MLRGELSGRLAKRIAAHADLREKVEKMPDAIRDLDDLLVTETKVLRQREEHRLTRKVNSANVAALILVAAAGGGGVYGLVTWALSAGGGWRALLYVIAGVYGLFFIALAAAGTRTVFDPVKK
jgi:hypothetical protein